MRLWILASLLALTPMAVQAGTLDRVRAEGVVHCGGVIHPGLLFPAPDGSYRGLEADVCRAIATAALGANARVDVHAYTLPRSYDAVRNGTDDVYFLTMSDILAAGLLPYVVPGPTVFYQSDAVLVPAASPAQRLTDLAGKLICGEPGTGPERSLIAWFAAHHTDLVFSPFQEAEEMLDAFYAGRCDAVVNQRTSLAALMLQAAEDGHPSRLLPDTVSAAPLMATTGRADAAWGAVVAWTVDTLLRGEMAGQPGPGGGTDPLPLAGAALGLAPDWQSEVIKATGNYGAIYAADIGAGSPLGLPRGLNALWTDGGLMCPPFSE